MKSFLKSSARHKTLTRATNHQVRSQKSKDEIWNLIYWCWWGVWDTGDSGGTLAAEGVELIDAQSAISARLA